MKAQTTQSIGYVTVAGWGSARHAREVRGRETLRIVRALLAQGVVVLADTDRGPRRLVKAGRLIVTRLP